MAAFQSIPLGFSAKRLKQHTAYEMSSLAQITSYSSDSINERNDGVPFVLSLLEMVDSPILHSVDTYHMD